MARKLPHKDVAIIGLGWTGSILANELTDAGLDVVAIERGPWRDTATDFPISYAQDELRYRIQHDLFLRNSQMAVTFRNNASQTALPVRTWGAFMLGNGVGGAGVHWNAETWRFLPTDFTMRSHLTQRYGANFLPEDMTIQDWGVTWDDLEPHYDAFEYLCGTSGQAGNVAGTIQDGGNPFEGPRSRPYPTPPMKQGYGHALFADAAKQLGYKPFPQPSGNLSQSYTNPLGVTLGQCTYCGFCEWFGCANYSKASPQTTILPVLLRKTNFEGRTECEVTRINLDNTGKRATGVTYVDSSGEEYEQPADLVLLCAFSLFNAQLLLLSGIGQPYDPASRTGPDRPQLHPPDRVERDRFLRQGQIQLQSLRRRRRDRHVHRRIQRRQFRPRPVGLRRRRLSRPGADQRPADRSHRGAAGHAGMGLEMETGAARQLFEHDQCRRRRTRLDVQLSRQLSQPRSDL